MNQTDIRSQVLLKLYNSFFLSFDGCSLRGLVDQEGWERTPFLNVLDRLSHEGLIKGRPGWFYTITGLGAVHAEETGVAPQEFVTRNRKARTLILNVLAKVYEEKGNLYSASMTDIAEQTGLDELALKSNRQVLMDLNYMESVGNAQFTITYRGLDAIKEYEKIKPNEIGRSTGPTSNQPEVRTRTQVFFSYSRKDKKWLELFQTSLRPFIRANQISVWDDTKIKAGDLWRDEIEQALASAKVAVLLVSRNFLASDFIAENELPPLLEAAHHEGLKILLVVVGHSLFEETEIGRYHAVNDPSRPLAGISAANREKEVVRICREIKAAATVETSEGVIRQSGLLRDKDTAQLKQIGSERIKPVQDRAESIKEPAKEVGLQALSIDSAKDEIVSLIIMEGRPMTFKEIADRLGNSIMRRDISNSLDELVRAGIIERDTPNKYSNSVYKLAR